MNKEPRLRFTEEERSDPALEKPIRKAEKAAAKCAGQTAGGTAKTASKTGKAAKTVKEKAQQAGAFVMRHKKGFGIVLALFLVVCLLMNTCLLYTSDAADE